MPNAQYFNPQNELEAKRRMRLAQALQAASQTPQAPPGTVVAQSPWAGLARGIMGGVGQYQEGLADQMTSKDAADRQKFLQQAVMGSGGDMNKMSEAFMAQPDYAEMGVKMRLDDAKEKRTEAYQQRMLDLQERRIGAMGAGGGGTVKPPPSGVANRQDEILSQIGSAKNIEKDAMDMVSLIDSGTLKLSPMDNTKSWFKNVTNNSDVSSRAKDTYDRKVSKLRNDALLLTKGTQTEGDAKRALDEIESNPYDTQKSRAAFVDLALAVKRAKADKMIQVDSLRSTYNLPQFDYSVYDNPASAISAVPAAGAAPAQPVALSTDKPSGGMATIKGDDEYNALPSGALFIGPDGQQRKKP